MAALRRRALRLFGTESPGDALFKAGSGLFALLVGALFFVVVLVLAHEALPSLRAFGPAYLWSGAAGLGPGGALPYIYGTFVSSVVALAIALPIALGSAVALVHILPRWLASPLGVVVELLAAVPSIVFGVWGLTVVAPAVRSLAPGQTLTGESLLTAGIVLACMVLPIVTAIARDMIAAVPRFQADAAHALGATRWEVVWKVVLPNARPGIVAAAILGFGRAVGETMAVILVSGNVVGFPRSLFDPTYTMSALVANKFGEAGAGTERGGLMEMGLVLLVFSLVLNVTAKLLVRRMGRRMGVGA